MESDTEQHLHALSPLFAAAKTARALVVPAILVLFASGGSPFGMWGATGARIWVTIALVFVAVVALLPYLIFRYTLAEDEMVIRDGIFTRTERHIPYARIQNIDLVQNPLHRAFDVALVRVETASGGKPEAVLRVLSLDAIEQMRARVFAGRSDAHAMPVEVSADGGERPAALRAPRRRLLLPLPTSELAKFRAPDMPFGPRRNDGVRLSLLSGAKDPKRGLQELKRRRKHLTFTPKHAEYITGRIMASQVIHGTSIPHALPSQSRGHGQRAPCRGSAGRTGHLL